MEPAEQTVGAAGPGLAGVRRGEAGVADGAAAGRDASPSAVGAQPDRCVASCARSAGPPATSSEAAGPDRSRARRTSCSSQRRTAPCSEDSRGGPSGGIALASDRRGVRVAQGDGRGGDVRLKSVLHDWDDEVGRDPAHLSRRHGPGRTTGDHRTDPPGAHDPGAPMLSAALLDPISSPTPAVASAPRRVTRLLERAGRAWQRAPAGRRAALIEAVTADRLRVRPPLGALRLLRRPDSAAC